MLEALKDNHSLFLITLRFMPSVKFKYSSNRGAQYLISECMNQSLFGFVVEFLYKYIEFITKKVMNCLFKIRQRVSLCSTKEIGKKQDLTPLVALFDIKFSLCYSFLMNKRILGILRLS